jgi:hypothetical protein
MRLLAAMLVGAAACAASAQTMTYFWTVTTDDGDTDVTLGERAYLSMWAHMEPEAVGFAGATYDLRGVRNWDTGEVESYYTLLTDLFLHGSLQENNDIVGVQSFQLPPLFNPDFVDDNPVELYRIIWSTGDYSPRMVQVGDANHLNNDVYTDEFGTSVPYEGVPGVARFTVGVPGPGAVAVLGIAGLRAGRRRR